MNSSENQAFISLRNVSLAYDLYHDKSNTLKERVVGYIHRRKYVQKKKESLMAIRNVSLELRNGDRLGIIGLNGAGKSSLLKIISGILRPSSGEMHVRGSIQPLIEMGAGFNPEFSGRENIYLNGYMLGFSKRQIRQKEREIIDFTELGSFIDVPIKYYSSGMVVRLAFTIATMIEPETLVFDEMLSAGDAEFLSKARQRIDQLLTSAKMLVLVSHDLSLIQSLARRVIVMDKGEVVFDGETEDGIRFYHDMVSKKIQGKNSQVTQIDAESKPVGTLIKIHHSGLKQARGQQMKNIVVPDDDLDFEISYRTEELFTDFWINLVIEDRTGASVAHLRNDFAEIPINNIPAGEHKATLTVCANPLRSDSYRYYFRLVGRRENGELLTQDSEYENLEVTGSRKNHHFLRQKWNLVDLG